MMTIPIPPPDIDPVAPLPTVAPTEAELRANDLEAEELGAQDNDSPPNGGDAPGFVKKREL